MKYKQIIISVVIAVFSISISLNAFSKEPKQINDPRIGLKLTNSEKVEFLQEMRQMLRSIQGIVSGIGTENREQIVKSAKYSGNRMARATPEAVTKKLPQLFKSIGGPTHMMFEQLAVIAEDDDMETLTQYTGEIMNQCLRCHETFKITVVN